MQFTLTQLVATALVASLSMVQASPVNQIDTTVVVDDPPLGIAVDVSSVEPRDSRSGVGRVWMDSYQGGRNARINIDRLPSKCHNLRDPYHDGISSIKVDSDVSCTFYMDARCKGAELVAGIFDDLKGTIYQDNLTSYKCMELSIPGTPARPGKR